MVKIGTKLYQLKVWDYENYPSDSPDRIIADVRINGFSSEINSGLGQLDFMLERNLQDWNENNDIALNNVVELLVNDIDTDDYIKIYTGYVSRINFEYSRQKKTVVVNCLGFVSRLNFDIYKNGTTSTISESSADPSTMFKNTIDKLKDESNGNITFLTYNTLPTSSVETTGLSVDASFKSKTYFEALEMCRELAPANWFWKLDEDNVFHFASKPITPTHNFSLGSIEKLEINYSLEEVRNGVLIWDNDVVYRYLSNANSISTYGRRIERMTAPQADATNAMDKKANAFLGQFKDPVTIIRLTIADNNEFESYGDLAGYDIENIKVGETCRISGIDESASAFLSTNLFIVRVEYQPIKAVIDLAVSRPEFEKFLVNLKKDTENVEKDTIPSSYTVV